MKYTLSLLVLTVTLMCSFAFFAPANLLISVAAQSTSPQGSYGFVVGASQIDSVGANGGAVLGLMNFDEAGNVTGTATVKPRDTNPQNAKAILSTFAGTYSSNPDGTGSVVLSFDVGFTATFATVTTDGGLVLRLAGAAGCSLCGADVPLQLQNDSLSGALPIGLLLQGTTGTIPLSLSNVTKDVGGPTATVYSAAGLTGSGTARCSDGSIGNWTASVPNVTLVVNNGVGNFLAAAGGRVCGQADFETMSGLVYTTAGPGGVTNVVLHAISGGVMSGIARAAGGSSLNGSYGVQLDFSPFPAGTVGVMTFDGAGNVNVALMNVGGTLSSPTSGTFSGTYSINPDGSGSINLKNASGQPAQTYAFVITDGGSELLLLRTDNNPAFNVAFGTARLQ